MTVAELKRVLVEMSRPHAPPGRGGSRGHARGSGLARHDGELQRGLSAKLLALWIGGWHLGVVRDRTDAGLARWFRRQTGLDAIRWAKPGELGRAVDALQAWLAREAGVDWSPYPELGANGERRKVERPQARALEAQWRILHREGVVRDGDLSALGAYASEHADLGRADSHLALSGGETVALMQELGAQIRRAQIQEVDGGG